MSFASGPSPSNPIAPTSIDTDWLHRLSPPGRVLHIGAGSGTGPMHAWRAWSVPEALILDADAERLSWTKPLIDRHPDWRAMAVLVADTDAQATFHHASNPGEDGLIPPESLSALWPNLRATAQESLSAKRLETLLQETGFSAASAEGPEDTWALIDCLPAATVLRGAGAELQHWGLVWCRVLLRRIDAMTEDATLDSVEALLTPLGFNCIHVSEGNHPAVGEALFIRDWKTVLRPQLDGLREQLDQSTSAAETLRAELAERERQHREQITALTQERDTGVEQADRLKTEQTRQIEAQSTQIAELRRAQEHQLQLAADRLEQLEALQNERAALQTRTAEQAAKLDAVTRARDEQARRATERQQQIDTLQTEREALQAQVTEQKAKLEDLARAREEQAKLATGRQQQLDTISQAKAELEKQHANLAKARAEDVKALEQLENLRTQVSTLSADRDQQRKLATERQQQLEAIQKEREALQAQATEQRTKLDAVTRARDEQTKLAAECQDRIKQLEDQLSSQAERLQELEAELADKDVRQQQFGEEMIKAEAQIELIKDLLLREPNL